jgi:hypothetical protein
MMEGPHGDLGDTLFAAPNGSSSRLISIFAAGVCGLFLAICDLT